MGSLALERADVIVGVDTHKDQHVAAALDHIGRLLGIAEFPATGAGYQQLHAWLASHGEISAVGVEGCGSWGAGLARHLGSVDVVVVEVNRPNRQTRRRRGKSDSLDAEAAARAVLSGDAKATPKSGDGPVEALRQLRVARAGAVKARTAAANQLHSLLDTAPDQLRSQLAPLTFKEKVALAERLRPGTSGDIGAMTRRALRSVARRWRFLDDEAKELRAEAKKIIDAVAPELVAAADRRSSPLSITEIPQVLRRGGEPVLSVGQVVVITSCSSSSLIAIGSEQLGQWPPMPTRRMKVTQSAQRCSPTARAPQVSHS